jgi:hypothetical protein
MTTALARAAMTRAAKASGRPASPHGPVGVSRPLAPTNRGPVADAAEVLDGDPATGVFGDGHDTLRDDVVGVALVAGLLALQELELALRRSGAPALAVPPRG